jgi:thymidine phosphorylase
VGRRLDLQVEVAQTDGAAPVGRGLGPALEARDVLAVLQGRPEAPGDLRARALAFAGRLLEIGGAATAGVGPALASRLLDEGRAWRKFQAICEAQGGMREPPTAAHRHEVRSAGAGRIVSIDNRKLARVAKLAGAPTDPAAGLDLHVRLGDAVERDQPLFTVQAEAAGELAYALEYLAGQTDVLTVEAGA